MKVELKKSQCLNIVDFIETWLIHTIREDEDIDNLDYLEDMLDARKALMKAVNEYEGVGS